ncbi:MAG: hypothetical protein IT337_05415 [Thermomicrobiales bacterium]|nr:hypothetical protein [Thermomicrobiales bacterium]
MTIQDATWVLLAANAGIAYVFAWALLKTAGDDPWRLVVRDWVGSKALWLAMLAVYWALDWIDFTVTAPPLAKVIYVLSLVSYSVFHARACVNWFVGTGGPGAAA